MEKKEKVVFNVSPYVFPGIPKEVLNYSIHPNLTNKNLYGVDEIIRVVAADFSITYSNILSDSRKREYVDARKLLTYVLRNHYYLSYQKIGSVLGGKNHATAIHAEKHFKLLYNQYREYRNKCDVICKRIGIILKVGD